MTNGYDHTKKPMNITKATRENNKIAGAKVTDEKSKPLSSQKRSAGKSQNDS